jgi:hypothetical protein
MYLYTEKGLQGHWKGTEQGNKWVTYLNVS